MTASSVIRVSYTGKLGSKTEPSQKSSTLKWTFHKNELFTEIRDLKTHPKDKNYNVIFHMEPSQKSLTLKWTLYKNRRVENGPFTKIREVMTDPKNKNYNVKFHTRSAENDFTRKWLTNFIKLHFSQKLKKKKSQK